MKFENQYRLKIDGDDFEKIGWDMFVQNKFPNYEVFWQKFVVQRTNRPANIRFRDGIGEEERKLAMLHYTIFKHFLFIYQNIHQINNRDIFDYLYIKLSSIIDVTEEFVFRFLIYINKLSYDAIISKYKNKEFEFKEEEARKKLIKGMNVTIPVIKKFDEIRDVYDFQEIKEFEKLASKIKGYRNIIIHSWPFFQIDTRVPKKEIVFDMDYRDWWKIIKLLENPLTSQDTINNKYIEMGQLINQDVEQLIGLINLIWNKIIIDVDIFQNETEN